MSDDKVPNAVDRHVGNRVRLRRMTVGMSQEKLGEALGVTFQQVQKYEKGTNRISASRLYYTSRILGVSVSHFFEGLSKIGEDGRDSGFSEPDAPGYDAGFEDMMATYDGVKLCKNFLKIKDVAARKLLVTQAEFFAGKD